MTDHGPDSSDCDLLDAYLARLHAGERPDREAILRGTRSWRHPWIVSTRWKCWRAPAIKHPTAGGQADGTVPGPGRAAARVRPLPALREIGRGGMGVVYEARQEGLDRSVAVKMILAGHLASPEMVRRFQTEAKAAARLHHSNIVHIHDVGQVAGQDYFTMEYIDGRSLAHRIAQGPIDVPAAVRLAGNGCPGRRAPASAGYHSPRLEAVEHSPRCRGRALCDRFRPGKVSSAAGTHGHGDHRGNAELHGARAGGRRASGTEPRSRRVQLRRDSLRTAHRRSPLPWGNGDGYPHGARLAATHSDRGRSTRESRGDWN